MKTNTCSMDQSSGRGSSRFFRVGVGKLTIPVHHGELQVTKAFADVVGSADEKAARAAISKEV